MIEELCIRDLALIDGARVGLHPALNVITGETGGGKSLVILGLKLLRGEKAGAELVRTGAKAAVVDGVFAVSRGSRSDTLRALLHDRLGLELEDERLIVTRVVETSGRTRALVNQRPVTLQVLREIGEHLIEIHGQGEAHSLMREDTQTELLDAFAATGELRQEFARTLARARAAADALAKCRQGSREREERIAFLQFQQKEIDRAAVEPGEVERVENEHRVLAHLDQLRRTLGEASELLREAEDSILDRLARVARLVDEAVDLDARLSGARKGLAEAQVFLSDAHEELYRGISRLDLDPGRLAEVEARLSELRKLLLRFGPGEAELLAHGARIGEELAQLAGPGHDLGTLERAVEAATAELAVQAETLTGRRRGAAQQLSREVGRELKDLGMERARIEFRVGEYAAAALVTEATTLGPSRVEIHFSANPGEPPVPLRKVASGGEVARVMLAVKKRLADNDRVPVLVFDEIDAEIGGRLGLTVGEKLRELARSHQVVCVTHLPQIAAFADCHVRVGKEVRGGRTFSVPELLDERQSAEELAAMAHGAAVDKEALREARRLVERVRLREPRQEPPRSAGA